MAITTATSAARLERRKDLSGLLIGALLFPLLITRRRPWRRAVVCLAGLFGMLCFGGCGARVAPESALPVQSFTVTVKATSTNLAGSVVVHSVDVTLGVE
jgi:hypothetical protein